MTTASDQRFATLLYISERMRFLRSAEGMAVTLEEKTAIWARMSELSSLMRNETLFPETRPGGGKVEGTPVLRSEAEIPLGVEAAAERTGTF